MSVLKIELTFQAQGILAISSKLILTFVLVVLSACSSTQIAYRNADWFITRVANDYLDLSYEQENAWTPSLQRLLQKHQEEELSHIVAFLNDLELRADDGLDQSDLACAEERLNDLFRRTARFAVAIASPLMTNLSDTQIRHLADRLRERQEKYRGDYFEGSSPQRLEKRVERVQKRIVRWTGELSSEQKTLIKSAVASWPDISKDWFDYRATKQRQLIALVAQRPTKKRMGQFLTGWWVEFSDRPPLLRQKHDLLKREVIVLLVSLDRTFNGAQRMQLVGNIGKLRRDLQGLLPDSLDDSLAVIKGSPCRSVTPGAADVEQVSDSNRRVVLARIR